MHYSIIIESKYNYGSSWGRDNKINIIYLIESDICYGRRGPLYGGFMGLGSLFLLSGWLDGVCELLKNVCYWAVSIPICAPWSLLLAQLLGLCCGVPFRVLAGCFCLAGYLCSRTAAAYVSFFASSQAASRPLFVIS